MSQLKAPLGRDALWACSLFLVLLSQCSELGAHCSVVGEDSTKLLGAVVQGLEFLSAVGQRPPFVPCPEGFFMPPPAPSVTAGFVEEGS